MKTYIILSGAISLATFHLIQSFITPADGSFFFQPLLIAGIFMCGYIFVRLVMDDIETALP